MNLSARITRFDARRERGGIFLRLMFFTFLAVLLAGLYLIRHPLLRVAGNFWVLDETPQSSDAIIILSDDNFNSDRAVRAAALYKDGWAPRIVASGVMLRPYAGIAELIQHDLVARGVPESTVVKFPHRARDTREEAAAISELVKEHGWKRILIVTSNFHTRRAGYIYERTLPPGTELRMIAAADSDYVPESWWTHREGIKIFFHESMGFLVALWEMRNYDSQTRSTLGQFKAI